MKIIWSPLAIGRATEIAEYIAQDKPSAAKKWIDYDLFKSRAAKIFSCVGQDCA